MRNLKRALSLTLASVMLLGMMVVGSSAAAGYDDVAETDNVEAIEVLQAIEVMVGDERGFGPERSVNRAEMAVVMGKLLSLDYNYYSTTCPFDDVYDWAQGWVGACAANGIVSGRGEGVYDPGATVTAVEAASMLMRALGYFKYSNDYADGFEVSTVRQGTIIGIFDGVGSSATEPMTRNQVAQMVLNALQSPVVEPDGNTINLTTPDGTVLTGKVNYVSVTSDKTFASAISRIQATSVGSTNDGWIVELGERLYDGKLKLNNDSIDDFGRPSRTWEYDSKTIGTYAKKELIRETYTAKVTGKTLYELLTRNVINDYDLEVFVDGALVTFDKNQLVRSNENSIRSSDVVEATWNNNGDITGNGVVTEVFVDPEAGRDGEITIVAVNTWLARANADYSATSETVTLEVYDRNIDNGYVIKRVSIEDVPAVANLKEDDFVLVNWASDTTSHATKDVLIISDVPEVLTDVEVNKFSKNVNDHTGHTGPTEDRVTDITTGGTDYKNSFKAFYEYATLGDYNGELLSKKTYDIYMDKYGYFIGAALHSGDDQYVFISAANNNLTSLGLRNSDALAIFTDGTLATINVNVTDTNENIRRMYYDHDDNVATPNVPYNNDAKYATWTQDTKDVNRWFTYTEDNGVYTLTPVTRYSYDEATGTTPAEEITVKSDNVSLRSTAVDVATGNAYGEDASVYITVDLTRSEKGNYPVDEITGLYTGVQSVRLTYKQNQYTPVNPTGTVDGYPGYENGWISAVYDKNNNIIAAVVHGEAEGSTDNFAYILGGAKSEGLEDGVYNWTFDAILGGEIQTLTIKSRFANTVDKLVPWTVQELIFDTNGNVSTIKNIDNEFATTPPAAKPAKNDVFDNSEYLVNFTNPGTYISSDFDVYHIDLYDDYGGVINNVTSTKPKNAGVEMTFQGNTLHFEDAGDRDDRGLAIMNTAKAVVRQQVNGSWKNTPYGSVREAYAMLANAQPNRTDGNFYFYGEVWAVLNSSGRAEWVFFYDRTPVTSGNQNPYDTKYGNIQLNSTTGIASLSAGLEMVTTNQTVTPAEQFTMVLESGYSASKAAASTGGSVVCSNTITNTWTITAPTKGDILVINVTKVPERVSDDITILEANARMLVSGDLTINKAWNPSDLGVNEIEIPDGVTLSVLAFDTSGVVGSQRITAIGANGTGKFDVTGTMKIKATDVISAEIAARNLDIVGSSNDTINFTENVTVRNNMTVSNSTASNTVAINLNSGAKLSVGNALTGYQNVSTNQVTITINLGSTLDYGTATVSNVNIVENSGTTLTGTGVLSGCDVTVGGTNAGRAVIGSMIGGKLTLVKGEVVASTALNPKTVTKTLSDTVKVEIKAGATVSAAVVEGITGAKENPSGTYTSSGSATSTQFTASAPATVPAAANAKVPDTSAVGTMPTAVPALTKGDGFEIGTDGKLVGWTKPTDTNSDEYKAMVYADAMIAWRAKVMDAIKAEPGIFSIDTTITRAFNWEKMSQSLMTSNGYTKYYVASDGTVWVNGHMLDNEENEAGKNRVIISVTVPEAGTLLARCRSGSSVVWTDTTNIRSAGTYALVADGGSLTNTTEYTWELILGDADTGDVLASGTFKWVAFAGIGAE